MAGDWAWLAIAASTFILRRALITVRSHDEPIGETFELSAEDLASLG
jgi:hypothetical protein